MSARKYFKDDSILLNSSYVRNHRDKEGEEEKKDEPALIKKKLPKGKDKTTIIYVQVNSDKPNQSVIMEEFVFNLD